MEHQKLLVTMKDIQRYKVLKDVIEKKLKGTEASHVLGINHVHVSRLKKRLIQEGFDGLPRKSPASAPIRKCTFLSLYVDKASHFKTTRHAGLPYQVTHEHDETQIERALHELNINLITANSPQVKGRIEGHLSTLPRSPH
jgi:hypothetical protein